MNNRRPRPPPTHWNTHKHLELRAIACGTSEDDPHIEGYGLVTVFQNGQNVGLLCVAGDLDVKISAWLNKVTARDDAGRPKNAGNARPLELQLSAVARDPKTTASVPGHTTIGVYQAKRPVGNLWVEPKRAAEIVDLFSGAALE